MESQTSDALSVNNTSFKCTKCTLNDDSCSSFVSNAQFDVKAQGVSYIYYLRISFKDYDIIKRWVLWRGERRRGGFGSVSVVMVG